MEHKIREDKVLEFKSLTTSRAVFKQMQELKQEQVRDYFLLEDRDWWDTGNWVGYVIETSPSSVGEIQEAWFIIELNGTLKRVRDMELWWVMKSDAHSQPTVELRQLLRQIFLK